MSLFEDKAHPVTDDSISFPIPKGVHTPWFKSAGGTPVTLKYYNGTIIDAVEATAKSVPDNYAYNFYGHKVKYKEFIVQVHDAAKALRANGVNVGDTVTICMPNTPQAVILFYAVNRIGAVANMIHPLSGEIEIVNYLNRSKSVLCLTLQQFYPKFEKIRGSINKTKLLICDIADGLSGFKKASYLFSRKSTGNLHENADVILWKNFIKSGKNYNGDYIHCGNSADTAAILYSGGTTGVNKGILLSNLNFNALALQIGSSGNCFYPKGTCLSIMPVFHGFGLGICVHTMLYGGITAILVPRFNIKSYCKLLAKYKPNYIAGVPTLFEALLRMKNVQRLDMSQIKGIFSGGDSLSVELKNKVDLFLKNHGSTEQLREGYGTTETVTACCLTPRFVHKDGSIGIPFPDTYFKICTPATHDEVPYGAVGEICISGPTVMKGYLDNPGETASALQLHADGQIWLHTGDLGSMDENGYVYFKQRLKRMIVTSGFNVFPSQVENAIDSHESVLISTVIGVKDNYKMQRVKAFIVLKPNVEPTEALKKEILAHCAARLPKYALPRDIEFRTELPKTLVGKIAFTVLEDEERNKGENNISGKSGGGE